MHRFPDLHIWGLLGDSFAPSDTGTFFARVAELVSPAETDDSAQVYPYEEKTDGWSRGEVIKAQSLRDLITGGSGVKLGGSTGNRRIHYKDLPVTATLHATADVSLLPAYDLWVPGDRFNPDGSSPETTFETHVEQAIGLAIAVYNTADVEYSYGFAQQGRRPLDEHPDRDALTTGEIPFVDWLVILPPHLVESIGRTHVLDLPAWRVIELDDGSVCLVSHENPTEQGIESRQQVTEYLRRGN